MLLLDEVVQLSDDHIVTRLTVRADGLFDSLGEVPAWVGLEYMAQTMSALNGHILLQQGKTVRLGFLAGTRGFVSHVPAFSCGDVLHVRAVRDLQTDAGLGSFSCRVELWMEDRRTILCEARVNAYAPENPGDYYDAARFADARAVIGDS
jgi:predicted hotdog family 3-hydroxylacyl-ACP dehydratase